MISLAGLLGLVQTHGLALLVPLAILEGPIVTVLAGYLVQLGLMNAGAVYAVVVLGDLVGDGLMYLLGRCGPGRLSRRWRARLGLRRGRLTHLAAHFRDKGGRTLVLAKLTHSLGFAALVAAGMARMPFGAFLWYNLLAALPKSLGFLALGYSFGYAYAQIDTYIWRGSLAGLALLGGLGFFWYRHRRTPA